MSRKRSNFSPETPPSKRYLNAALAREMEALRISRSAPRSPLINPVLSPRNAFGTPEAQSPFLTPPQSSAFASPLYAESPATAPVFGDLSHTLPEGLRYGAPMVGDNRDEQPVVSSPQSSTSSMALDNDNNEDDDDEDDDNNNVNHNNSHSTNRNHAFTNHHYATPNNDVVITSASDDAHVDVPYDSDVTVVESPDHFSSASSFPHSSSHSSLSPSESRLVVYKPPVNSSPAAIAALNAALPDGHFALRNNQSRDWYIVPPAEASKRKLAVVPWTPQTKRLRDLMQRPDTVIPMPWTGSNPSQLPTQFDQSMEIEEIS